MNTTLVPYTSSCKHKFRGNTIIYTHYTQLAIASLLWLHRCFAWFIHWFCNITELHFSKLILIVVAQVLLCTCSLIHIQPRIEFITVFISAFYFIHWILSSQTPGLIRTHSRTHCQLNEPRNDKTSAHNGTARSTEPLLCESQSPPTPTTLSPPGLVWLGSVRRRWRWWYQCENRTF